MSGGMIKTHDELADAFAEYCEKAGKDLSMMEDNDIKSFLRDMVRTYRRKHNRYVTNVELIESLGCYPETRVLIEAEEEGSFVDITAENIGYCSVELNAMDLKPGYGPHILDHGGTLVLVISRKKINNSPPRPSN